MPGPRSFRFLVVVVVMWHTRGGGCTSHAGPDHEGASGDVPVSRRRATMAQTCRLMA